MLTGLADLQVAFVVGVGGAGLVLLVAPGRLARVGASVLGAFVRWWTLAVGAAAVYGAVVAYDLAFGLYSCARAAGASDALAFLASGRAFLSGGDPFQVANCGSTVAIPYGLATVLVNALGSLGGLAGIAVVWGAVTVLVLPLTWWVAGPAGRGAALAVATSLLYLPLAVVQIDGASNMLVPLAVLATLALAARGGPIAGAVGGVLATGRFPSLFPSVGATGRFSRPFVSGAVAVAAFALVTGGTYLAYGRGFFDLVFAGEVGRRSFSLNFWGPLLAQGWLPAGLAIPVLQAAAIVIVVGLVWWRASTAVGAAAITLVAIALATQYLSFNILAWLLPAALVPGRPRAWLWAIGVAGTAAYYVGYLYGVVGLGVLWPYDLLDVLVSVLLAGLLYDLVRWDRSAGRAPATGAPTTS